MFLEIIFQNLCSSLATISLNLLSRIFLSPTKVIFEILVASPLLILLALLGLFQRQGNSRLQILPAVMVASGLVISGALGHRRNRYKLLMSLRKSDENLS